MSEGVVRIVDPPDLSAILAQQAYVARAIEVYEALLLIEDEADDATVVSIDHNESGDWHGTAGHACASMASLPGCVLALARGLRR